MYDLSGELTVILITILWLQKLEKDYQEVNKQHRSFDVERFNLRKLSEPEVRKQYRFKISSRFAALENFSDSEDINRAWENTKENIRTSVKESLGLHKLKQHKSLFEEECLVFFIKGSRLACSGYMIQTEALWII